MTLRMGEESLVEVAVVARDACAWPVVTRLGGDRIGVVFHNRPSHGFLEGDVEAVVSSDGGRSWTAAGVPAPHEPGSNRVHIASGIDPAGNWVVLTTGHKVTAGRMVGAAPLWYSRCASLEKGEWRIQRHLDLRLPVPFCIPHGRIWPVGEDRLVATVYQSQGPGRPSRTWVIVSDDGGASWASVSQIGDGDTNEAVLLPIENGKQWIAAVRTHRDHHVDLFRAPDPSGPWTLQGAVTLPMQHPADLSALGDGRILLTYGIRNKGLMGIGARPSADFGKTWGAPVVLCTFPGATDCGYPSTVPLDRNGEHLFTACYTNHSLRHTGYQLLSLHWRFTDWFTPRPLRSISDGHPLQI
ncbi:MAG: exo-alpha-sialidase [Verrucomicrobia bacterium]|nr:MAG: exo-alpha-sialidase [Verrucomicrobiota bacterium]